MGITKQITVLQLNDCHSYLESHQEVFFESGEKIFRTAGGFEKISGYINKLREDKTKDLLVLDCGDTFHGTYPALATRGEIMVPVLNRLGIAAMTGHWDFAYGKEQLDSLLSKLEYPMLAINIFDRDTRELAYLPYIVKDFGDCRIGIIGIASNISDKIMSNESGELQFTLGREELPGYIKLLREEEQVSVIILISHLGFPQNMKLLSEVEGIDICLSGHTHYRTTTPAKQGKTLVIESGCHGSFLGRLDIELKEGKIKSITHELVEVNATLPEDTTMQELLDELMLPFRESLSEIVGFTATPLDRNSILESTMDNFLLTCIKEESHADIAFSNGWRYGAPIASGPVTMNDLFNIIPMNPYLETVEITGQELIRMLEENLESTFSGDAYGQKGGFVKRCLGLKAFIKIEAPMGSRIRKIFVNNEELELHKRYTAAFVTKLGVPKKYGINRRDMGTRAVDAMKNYLAKRSPVTVDIHGTFTAI